MKDSDIDKHMERLIEESQDIDKHIDKIGELLQPDYYTDKIEEMQTTNLLNREQEEEELLMELYEKETGKNPITARKTVRKDYTKWKSGELQEESTKEVIKEEMEIKKTSDLRNWL